MTDTSELVTALDLPPVDPLPDETAKYFAICEDKLGLVPNVLKAYAFDIDKLNTFAALYRVADIDARTMAMLDYAVALTEASAKVTEADRETLRGHGVSDRDIWDIASVTGFFNMTNRLASGVDMRTNTEYHGAHR